MEEDVEAVAVARVGVPSRVRVSCPPAGVDGEESQNPEGGRVEGPVGGLTSEERVRRDRGSEAAAAVEFRWRSH